MSDDQLRRIVRLIIVQELTILARVLGDQSAANAYAIQSLRADQEREPHP